MDKTERLLDLIALFLDAREPLSFGDLREAFPEEYGKGEQATPETYRNSIARSLQRLTGQSFGANKQDWQRWWQEKGCLNTRLQ